MEIEKISKEAVELRESGFNCAQAVLCAMREYTKLDDKVALSVAGAFGGGLGCGEICGAISGGAMAVGMVLPYLDNTDPESKKAIRTRAQSFVKAFNLKYGCCRCAELKAHGIGCPELVAFGAETAVKIIEENK